MAILHHERSSRLFELTVEKTETVVIRYKRELTTIWCSECNEESQMLPAAAAARSLDISLRSLLTRIESRTIHFVDGGGELLICSKTLKQ